MSTEITESLIFSKELENWRKAHGLTVTALGNLLGVTKQMMSDVLSNQKTFSAENLIKSKHILNIFDSMPNNNTPTTTDDYAAQNAAVLAKYATGKHARLLNFQSGLGLSAGDGFVAREPGDELTDIVNAINEISANADPDVVTARLRDLVKGWNRSVNGTVQKAQPNPYGATREAVRVQGGQGGARATWVDGQSFDRNGGVLNVNAKGLLEFCEKDVNKLTKARIDKTHKPVEQKVNLENKTQLNCSRYNMDAVGQWHTDAIMRSADPQMEAANRRAYAVKTEREARLAKGCGTVEDLSARLAQVKYLDSGLPGVSKVDSAVLNHEDAYFKLMLEVDRLNRK